MTVISSDPEADADDLDDQAMLEAYLGTGCMTDANTSPSGDIPDWPPSHSQDAGVKLDGDIVSWFRANHANWQLEIRLVLRGWIAAQTATPSRPGER